MWSIIWVYTGEDSVFKINSLALVTHHNKFGEIGPNTRNLNSPLALVSTYKIPILNRQSWGSNQYRRI